MPSAYQPTGTSALDQAISSLISSVNRPTMHSGVEVGQMERDANTQLQRLLMMRQGMGGGTLDPNSPQGRIEAARTKMYGLAQGRLDDLKGDPMDTLISENLQKMITGEVGPYDDATKNALITGATQGNAEAAGNQYQDLLSSVVATGGNASDPSLMAERNALESQRLKNNQSASLGVLQNANVQNFGARQSAIGQGAAFNSNRNSAITNQSNYLGNLYSKETANVETPAQSYSMPNFAQWQQYSQAPQPAPQSNYTYNQPQSPVWASSHGGSVWAGSGIPNPAPVGSGSGTAAYNAPQGYSDARDYPQYGGPPSVANWTMPLAQRQPTNGSRYGATQMNPAAQGGY